MSVETIIGTPGADVLTGGVDPEFVSGLGSNDFIDGNSGDDTLDGGEGDDTLIGGPGADSIDGGGGSDQAWYSDATAGIVADLLNGTVEDGTGSTDSIANVEWIFGSPFADLIVGSLSSQFFAPGDGADTIDGGNGELWYSDANSSAGVIVKLAGWIANSGELPSNYTGSGLDPWGNIDVLRNMRNVEGTDKGDLIVGNSASNILDGRGGSDTLDGGEGWDRAEYNNAISAIVVDLSQGRAFDDGQRLGGADSVVAVAQDFLISIENISGGPGNDSITGDNGTNQLWGEAGADTLLGLGSNDTLGGGAGNDVLQGGLGADYFSLLNDEGSDTIEGGGYNTLSPWPSRLTVPENGNDFDLIDYRTHAGITLDLSTGTVSVSGLSGIDSYINVELVLGSFAKDIVTGRPSQGFVSNPSVGNSFQFSGYGGSDVVTQTPYSNQGMWATGIGGSWSDGLQVSYSWSDTPITINWVGNQAKVSYGAGSGAKAGTKIAYGAGEDTLSNIKVIQTTDYDDVINGEGATLNHLGYLTNPYGRNAHFVIDARGGNDLIRGNGNFILAASVNTSTQADPADGRGMLVDGRVVDVNGMLTMDLSHLKAAYSSSTPHGIVKFSGVNYVQGTKYNDTVYAGNGVDEFRGYAGNDLFVGNEAINRSSYRNATNAIQVDLEMGAVGDRASETSGNPQGGTSNGSDTLIGVERVEGTRFDDIFDALNFSENSQNAGGIAAGWKGMRNWFDPQGGNDTVIGNGYTGLVYRSAMLGIKADLAAGYVDALTIDTTLLASPDYLFSVGRTTFSGVAEIEGTDYSDLLVGGTSTMIIGNESVEIFSPRGGADTVDGRDHFDLVSYTSSPNPIQVDMRRESGQIIDDGWGSSDTLISVARIDGSHFNDFYIGDGADGVFGGGRGADTIDGGGGFDKVSYSASRLADSTGLGGVIVDLGGTAVDTSVRSVTVFAANLSQSATSAKPTSLPNGFTGWARDNWGEIDLIKDTEGVEASDWDDVLIGSDSDNRLDGREGADTIDGAGGTDLVEYNHAEHAVVVNLSLGLAANDGSGFEDVLRNIEGVHGSIYADQLTGDSANNVLQAEAGADTLIGGAGNDTLEGGAGIDVAVFSGQRSAYVISYDQTTQRYWINSALEGIDTVSNVERFSFADGIIEEAQLGSNALEGFAYHWKSHALLPSITVMGLDSKSVRADSADRFDLRAATLDAVNDTLIAELWMNNGPEAVSNFDFTSETTGVSSTKFISSLDPGEWTVNVNASDPNRVIVAGYMKDAEDGLSGSVRLGTIQFTKASPSPIPPSPTTSAFLALNFDARLPIVPTTVWSVGEPEPVELTLNVDDSFTFSHVLHVPLYDKLGLQHTISLYFRRFGGNFYNLYVAVDGQIFASTFDNNKITIQMPSKAEETEGGDGDTEPTAPIPVASFGFFEGNLVSVGPAINADAETPALSEEAGNLTLEFQISPPEGEPLDPSLVLADPLQFSINFDNTTLFASAVEVKSFEQDGHAPGASPSGVIEIGDLKGPIQDPESLVPPQSTTGAVLALNFDARLPIVPTTVQRPGESGLVENVLDVDDSFTFSHVLDFPLYDKLGLQHTLSLYFRRIDGNFYNLYVNVDGQVFASSFEDNLIKIQMPTKPAADDGGDEEAEVVAPQPVASFGFFKGKLVSVGAAITADSEPPELSAEAGNLTLEFRIYPSEGEPLDPSLVLADPVSFWIHFPAGTLDVPTTTLFASPFEVKSLQQDGHGYRGSSPSNFSDTALRESNFVALNLDARLSIVPTSKIVDGEPAPVENVLDVNSPETFSHLVEFPLHDKLGLEHTLSLYLRRVSENFYNLYVNIDRQVFASSFEDNLIRIQMPTKPAADDGGDEEAEVVDPQPVASFGFFEGRLVSVGAAITEGSEPPELWHGVGNLTLEFQIDPPEGEPLDPSLVLVDPFQFKLNFYGTTNFAAPLMVTDFGYVGCSDLDESSLIFKPVEIGQSNAVEVNLDARFPIISPWIWVAGEPAPVEQQFDFQCSDTFSHLLQIPLYDKLGLQHTVSLYFRRVGADAYDVYINVDGQVFASAFDSGRITVNMPSVTDALTGVDTEGAHDGAPKPVASFRFVEGKLVEVGAAIPDGEVAPESDAEPGNLTLEFAIYPPSEAPLDSSLVLTDPINFKLDFTHSTNYASAFAANNLGMSANALGPYSAVSFTNIEIGELSIPDAQLGFRSDITAVDGHFAIPHPVSGEQTLLAFRSLGDGSPKGGVTAADALAALMIAVELNPNPDPDASGPKRALKVSPYQIIAADVNQDGKVSSIDAFTILKMAVGLADAPPPLWLFVPERTDFWNETDAKFTLNRLNASWSAETAADINQEQHNLVGVIRGDVNGSWSLSGAGTVEASNPSYFEDLATLLGVPLEQWGIA